MRHVSRTHRVALDWLFDRINLDPKIQIKYIDTKNQLADILTKGNFTREEWNHLLTLFNISHFSSTACTAAMAKRAQQESGEERVTAKSRLLGGNAHSTRYGETIHDGSGKPEKLDHQEQAYSENFVMGSDAVEFVNKVKDQVRNRQKRMSNVVKSGDEHSIIWGMFMATT